MHSLTLLPTEIRQEYKLAITDIFPDLRRETVISDVFYHLSPLIDFIGYGLLKCVIDQFGSNTLKTMMNSYADDVLHFMKRTTVKEVMDHWPGDDKNIPQNFSTLRAKIKEDPATYTLYQLDQLRKRYCCQVKLTDLIFVIIGLEMSHSFIVEWLVPSLYSLRLLDSPKDVNIGVFLHQSNISYMWMDEKQFFPSLFEYRSQTPPLMAGANKVCVNCTTSCCLAQLALTTRYTNGFRDHTI